jgi:hypothetical protein
MLSAAGAVLLFLVSLGYLMFRIGQQYEYNQKWKDYDDYGWS